MAISNMEKKICFDISTNSHRFFKSNYLYPRVAFSQYVLRQFLTLYFANTQDLKLLNAYFKILYLKNIMNSLVMASHYISLIEKEDQKLGIEKQYQELLFQSKQDALITSFVKADVSWIDESIEHVQRQILEIAGTLKQSQQIVLKNTEKLFERFQEILSISMFSFQKAYIESYHGELDINHFKKQIQYHLQQHLHLKDQFFFCKYGLTIAGCALILAAIGILFFPNIILSIGGNVLLVEIALGFMAALLILLNQYFPNSSEDYTKFIQVQ